MEGKNLDNGMISAVCDICASRFYSEEEFDTHTCDPARVPTKGNPIKSADLAPDGGVIATAPGGKRFSVSVDDSGAPSTPVEIV